MLVVFKPYYEEIKGKEQARPASQQRKLPSLEQLAQDVGLHPISFSKLINNRTHLVDKRIVGRLIRAMRDYGFPTQLGDILSYEEVEADIATQEVPND